MQPLKTADYDIITLKNIDDEDFEFTYGKSEDEPTHIIPKGETRSFPRFKAAHALKHLIDKILIKRGTKTINNARLRNEIAEQIVVSENIINETAVVKPKDDEDKKAEVSRPTDLEGVLKRNREREKSVEVVDKDPGHTPHAPKEPEEHFDGLEDEKLQGDEVDTTSPPQDPPQKEAKAVPTKSEIFAYGRKNGLKIGLEEEKEYTKMTIPQLLVEIGDPREALA